MYRVVGFTGTRFDVTKPQGKMLRQIVQIIKPKEGQHGDCVGADATMHRILRNSKCRITIRPPNDDSERAFCQGANRVMMPKAHLARNRDIVDNSDVLVATPRTVEEELRSGTWATIRYARKRFLPIIIIDPVGKVTTENIRLNSIMDQIK